MNEVQIFSSPEFGEIRTTGDRNNPLFCLADVCKAVGLTPKGVNQRLSDEVISNYPIIDSLGRTQMALFVSEDGLYDVILDSRKPEAKAFRKWITSEVLPAIRKHGAYMTPETIEEVLLSPDTIIKLATNLKAEQQRRVIAECKVAFLEEVTIENAPKVLFATAVEGSNHSCLVGELAKILYQNGVEIGQNRLFEWLRENNFLCTKGESHNIPTQKAMEMGLFEIKKRTVNKPDGTSIVTTTPKITGRGQIYFVNRFLRDK